MGTNNTEEGYCGKVNLVSQLSTQDTKLLLGFDKGRDDSISSESKVDISLCGTWQ